MIPTNLCLENELVSLRPLRKADLKELFFLTQDPGMWTYFTADLSIWEQLQSWAEPHFRQERLQFAVVEKKTNLLAGSTAFGNYSPKDQRIEIGWTWLGKEFRGKGINASMKGLMLDYCFDHLHIKRVEIKTDVLNTPARKALLRIGAQEEGVLRSHTLMTHGRRRDTIYYSFLEGEWMGQANKQL